MLDATYAAATGRAKRCRWATFSGSHNRGRYAVLRESAADSPEGGGGAHDGAFLGMGRVNEGDASVAAELNLQLMQVGADMTADCL